MHVPWNWWSVLAAAPYILEGVTHPYTQRAWYDVKKAWRVGSTALVLTVVLGSAPVLMEAQSRSGGQQRSRQQSGGGLKQNPAQVPIVAGDFKGTLRSIERKRLRLDVGEDQSVEFVRDHKTKFLRGDQEVTAKEIPEGSTVTVEATKHTSGDLIALKVVAAASKP